MFYYKRLYNNKFLVQIQHKKTLIIFLCSSLCIIHHSLLLVFDIYLKLVQMGNFFEVIILFLG